MQSNQYTLVECGVELSKYDDNTKVDHILFRSPIRSVRYLICIRLDICFGVGHVNCYLKAPCIMHLNATKKYHLTLKVLLTLGYITLLIMISNSKVFVTITRLVILV